jgi:hypothetical protein
MDRTIKPEILKAGTTGKYVLDGRRAADRDASSEQLAGGEGVGK